jgi:predicted nucleic acid-binding protein
VTGLLLDTNIVSELRRPKPEPKVVNFIASQPIDRLYISTVTFAEIRFGIELVTDAARRAELQEWLTLKVRPMFQQRTLAISEDVMLKWRLLVAEGRKIRTPFPSLISLSQQRHFSTISSSSRATRAITAWPKHGYSIRGWRIEV